MDELICTGRIPAAGCMDVLGGGLLCIASRCCWASHWCSPCCLEAASWRDEEHCLQPKHRPVWPAGDAAPFCRLKMLKILPLLACCPWFACLGAQVMHMLQGVSDPGPAFQLDPVRSTYTVVPGVHMHASSGGSTRALLTCFAELGSVLRSVHEFCQSMLTPDDGEGASGGIHSLGALMGSSVSTSGAAGAAGGGSSSRGGGQEGEDDNASLMLRVLLKGDTSRLRELPTAAAFAAALDSQLKVWGARSLPCARCTVGPGQKVCLLSIAAHHNHMASPCHPPFCSWPSRLPVKCPQLSLFSYTQALA